MKELAVISGKGGTGKTSLVASFAVLAQDVVLVDCDVDAPDLHLVLQPTIGTRTPFIGGKKARLDSTICIGCGQCANVCRFDALSLTGSGNDAIDKTYAVDTIACEGCGVCIAACPAQAIDMVPWVDGEWYISQTRCGPLVHACLNPGEGNSGKLVSLLRQQARELAQAESRELVLCDAAAGVGCPVIASVSGTQLALIVIEPTVSGRHDFRRALELTQHFGVPTLACINKCDLNKEMTREIEAELKEQDVELVGRVPYDEDVTRSQLQEKSVVESSCGPASTAISDVWARALTRLDHQVSVH